MKKFNQDIEIKISVDSIADKLLSTISPEEKHAELIAETVIGTLLNSNSQGMSMLFNALNGYNNEIDFKVGDEVVCEESHWGYVKMPKAEAFDDDKYERKNTKIGNCTVKEIDLYKSDKLLVEFNILDGKGGIETDTKWVSHKRCSKIELTESPVKRMLRQEDCI